MTEHGDERRARGLTWRRRLLAVVLAALLLPALTVVLAVTRDALSYPSQLLLYLSAVVLVSLVGGLWPALATALAASLLANWYFTPPFHTFSIDQPENALALLVFVGVAAAVASVVDLAARRTRQSDRARAEAHTLITLADDVLQEEDPLRALLDRVCETFEQQRVALVEQAERGPEVVASCGHPPAGPATTRVRADDTHALVLDGRPLQPGDERVLAVAARQAVLALERDRLAARAREASALAEVDRVRTALLAAVGHDLRTPLAAALAAVTSLRSPDVEWSDEDADDLLDTAETSLQRLDDVLANLLDMSRLQVGALAVTARPLVLDEVVASAVSHLSDVPDRVELDVPEDLPPVLADPGLLERVLVNVVGNALRHAPGLPVRVTAGVVASGTPHEAAEIRVVDRGPGIPTGAEDAVFAPFQQFDDRRTSGSGPGVGLGLAVARGFAEAMGGSCTPEETPEGGLTMVVRLPLAPPAPDPQRSPTEATR